MPEEVIGIEGADRGRSVAATMGEVGGRFAVRVGLGGGRRLPRWEGPRRGVDGPVEFRGLRLSPGWRVGRWLAGRE